MPINISNIKPFACRVTRINGTRNKSITSNLARKGLNKHSRRIVGITTIAALALLTIGSNVFASNSVYFAVQANDIVLEVTIPSTVSLPITPTASGAFGSTNLNVLVSTNNINGYTLNMTAQSTDLSRSNELADGTRPAISTLPSSATQSNFTTNRWGWMLSNTNQTGSSYYSNTTYYPMTTDTVMLNYYGPNTPTLTPANGNNTYTVTADPTELTFGVKMDTDVPNGTYGVTLVFEATTNYVPTCEQNKICYKSNGADGGTMGNQSATASTSTTLLASNYSYTNHGFLGWNTMPDGTGTYYGPNETITAPANMSEGLTLYAIWKEKALKDDGSPLYMQDFTSSTCSNTLTAAIYNSTYGKVTAQSSSFIALEDKRDGNVYAVARLVDGQCWMIENLRLGSTTISTQNTHNPNIPLKQTNSSGTRLDTTANSLSPSSTTWCTNISTDCYNYSYLSTVNTASRATNPTTGTDTAIYSYGNYYNWYSATAGNGTYSFGTKNNEVTGDICPLNWRLPHGGSFKNNTIKDSNGNYGTETVDGTGDSDFYNLVYGTINSAGTPNIIPKDSRWATYYGNSSGNAYIADSTIGSFTSQAMRAYPNNFLYSGHKPGSVIGSRGTSGLYWSATAYDNTFATGMNLSGVALYPGTSSTNKAVGFSIRCLAGS